MQDPQLFASLSMPFLYLNLYTVIIKLTFYHFSNNLITKYYKLTYTKDLFIQSEIEIEK